MKRLVLTHIFVFVEILYMIMIIVNTNATVLVSNIVKAIPALILVFMFAFGTIQYFNDKEPVVRFIVMCVTYTLFCIGDILLIFENKYVKLVGIISFAIGNCMFCALIFYNKSYKEITLKKLIAIGIISLITLIISIIPCVVLRIMCGMPLLQMFGGILFLTLHCISRISCIVISNNIMLHIVCCIGSLMFQVSDIFIMTLAFCGNVSGGNILHIVDMLLYYNGILIMSHLFYNFIENN